MKTFCSALSALLLVCYCSLQAADSSAPSNQTSTALTAADDARVAAMKAGDREKLTAIFSDELHYAHSTGDVDTKSSFIDKLTSGKTKYEAMDYEKRSFSFPASNMALMTGRLHIRATTGGNTTDAVLGFLGVWRFEHGTWRFLAWQSCKLPAK